MSRINFEVASALRTRWGLLFNVGPEWSEWSNVGPECPALRTRWGLLFNVGPECPECPQRRSGMPP